MMMVEFVRCSMMNEYVIELERFSVDDLIDYYYDILFEICQSNCPMNDVEHDNHRFRRNLRRNTCYINFFPNHNYDLLNRWSINGFE